MTNDPLTVYCNGKPYTFPDDTRTTEGLEDRIINELQKKQLEEDIAKLIDKISKDDQNDIAALINKIGADTI